VALQTIAIGIDLGTTNSSVAVNNNNVIEIVKKAGGVEYTPSVFGFDKAKNKVVGQRAYDLLYSDTTDAGVKNFKPEVKRIIGTPEKFYFERAGIEMTAEEISSEILKSLVQDIIRKYPKFNTTAAVITIPAAFSVLQCEATKRAGNLAGFKHVVLLQEPIAAAISYGFANAKNETWLVYDLGGGTFDVALISSKDGVLSVLGHNGDNFLGGKNLDWEIVDKILTPKITEAFSVENFRRDNKAHQGKFARLKFLAERAKMELSNYETTALEVDGIGDDDAGNPVVLPVEISRQEFENLMDPLVNRTIDLCKQTLKESGLTSSSISKIILVGGPTQIPYVRQRLEVDLSIQTDSSLDPLTVVARGACIFAMGQRIPDDEAQRKRALPAGIRALTLNYEALTAETEQTVTGIVEGLDEGQHYLKIQSDSGPFSGPKVNLKNGKFFTSVTLEPNKSNLFWVYVFDASDNPVALDPESFTITHGLSIAGAPLPHSIGVAVSTKGLKAGFGGSTDVFERLIERGSVLPAKKTEKYKTARALKKAQDDNPLWIRVGEGESEIPDRNAFVCELGIKGNDLPRDLPAGTDVELSVEINEIRELSVTAYIPLVDLTLNARSTFVDELIKVDDVEQELDAQIERARSMSSNYTDGQMEKVVNAVNSASTSLQNAHIDEDEKRKAVKQVRDLKQILDEAQQATEMPQLSKDFDEGIKSVTEIIAEIPDADDRNKQSLQLAEIKTEGEKAIRDTDKILLVGVNDRLRDLAGRAMFSHPATWVHHFRTLVNEGNFSSPREAAYFIERGQQAIEKNDIEGLKRSCRGLNALRPMERPRAAKVNTSGITR
jgi:molecular chaperone DnaK